MVNPRRPRPRPVRAQRPAPSPDERALLALHQTDADYSNARHRLAYLFAHASTVHLVIEWPSQTRRVDLEPADLSVLVNALRYDEVAGLD
jgi:hypothetical protein